jgi:glycosyltransferase involved in cell wall biosynthesis
MSEVAADHCVTVVIPTYNAAPFIAETLGSVFAQTRLPKEIIISDDCSTDATLDVVQGLSHGAPAPVRILRAAGNSGDPARPMNAGIEAARTPFVALLDQDDVMMPEKLQRQLALSQATGCRLTFADYLWFNEERSWAGLTAFDFDLFRLYGQDVQIGMVLPSDWIATHHVVRPGTIQSCSNLVFERDLWREHGPFDERCRFLSDYKFTLAVAAKENIGFVPQMLFRKRRHAGNAFQSPGEERRIRTAARLGIAYLPNAPWMRRKNTMSGLVKNWLFDRGAIFRIHGECRDALDCYRAYVKRFRPNFRLARAMIALAIASARGSGRDAETGSDIDVQGRTVPARSGPNVQG